ncbi:MAG: hypothetical protein AB7G76_14275 [Steroidobacteraceae bacterium]
MIPIQDDLARAVGTAPDPGFALAYAGKAMTRLADIHPTNACSG